MYNKMYFFWTYDANMEILQIIIIIIYIMQVVVNTFLENF